MDFDFVVTGQKYDKYAKKLKEECINFLRTLVEEKGKTRQLAREWFRKAYDVDDDVNASIVHHLDYPAHDCDIISVFIGEYDSIGFFVKRLDEDDNKVLFLDNISLDEIYYFCKGLYEYLTKDLHDDDDDNEGFENYPLDFDYLKYLCNNYIDNCKRQGENVEGYINELKGINTIQALANSGIGHDALGKFVGFLPDKIRFCTDY